MFSSGVFFSPHKNHVLWSLRPPPLALMLIMYMLPYDSMVFTKSRGLYQKNDHRGMACKRYTNQVLYIIVVKF